jgi:galactose mutarotase-like enzyme
MPRSGGFDRRFVGSPRQLARADLFEMVDGPGRGSRLARLTAAHGFDVEVLPDRGMDLGMVSWRGIPLCWLSPVGPIGPGRIGGSDEAWDRGFGGGLLTTCGLDQFGRASTSADGAPLPMHGRAHALSASSVRTSASPFGESATMSFSGTTRQATALGECLTLERVVTAEIGGSTLTIRDRVTNEAPVAWPHLILYHVNLGWPLIGPDSRLEVLTAGDGEAARHAPEPIPRDDAARAGLAEWSRMPAPQDAVDEQVFRHPLEPATHATVRVTSPSAGIALSLRFDTDSLPFLYQWKQASSGRYALGIEPANAVAIEGQAEARANGTLVVLQPGESRDYALSFHINTLRD